MVYSIRPMQNKDISQVSEIDREAFPNNWSSFSYVSYTHEMRNPLSHYIVACTQERADMRDNGSIPKGKIPWFKQHFRHNHTPEEKGRAPNEDYIVGFAGFRTVLNEAHLISIAVRNEYRREGIGERLLISVIELASKLNASIITLEARVSNKAAQALYKKYGFQEVGIRRGYYSDDGEDAVLMSTETINSAPFQSNFQQLEQAHTQKWKGKFTIR